MARIRLTLFQVLLLFVFILTPADAQETAPEGAQPAVTVVNPDDNGYPALLRAGAGPYFDEGEQDGGPLGVAVHMTFPLPLVRQAVDSPDVHDAIDKMRAALDFDVITPVFKDTNDMWELYYSVGHLGDFLACREVVLLADGKTSAAVDAFAEAVQIGERVKRWGMPGAYVGAGVEYRARRPLARHLDQLSARDCERLLVMVRAQLRSPDPAIDGFRAQKDFARMEIDEAIQTIIPTRDVRTTDADFYFQGMSPRERQQIVNLRASDPQGLADFRESAVERLSAMYDSVADAVSHYPDPAQNERSNPAAKVPGAGDTLDRFVRAASEPLATMAAIDNASNQVENIGVSRTLQQLLAVHAAILRWRWEHDAVPESLDVLKLGALEIDPFSGKPLLYTRVDQRHYTLESAGPISATEVTGRYVRRPLTIDGFKRGIH